MERKTAGKVEDSGDPGPCCGILLLEHGEFKELGSDGSLLSSKPYYLRVIICGVLSRPCSMKVVIIILR